MLLGPVILMAEKSIICKLLLILSFINKLNFMKRNMSNSDRVIRLILAAVLVILFLTKVGPPVLGYIFLAVAAIFVLNSIFSFCPLYALFGLSTKAEEKKE